VENTGTILRKMKEANKRNNAKTLNTQLLAKGTAIRLKLSCLEEERQSIGMNIPIKKIQRWMREDLLVKREPHFF
jgi:hypothetical protein